ncbi:MAG TPA: DUF3971 domain-containing protein, partial [Burkholderiales bacterium]
ARFSSLSARPDGALPGFRGLSGQFSASERGGTASITATGGAFDLPNVFIQPVPLDFLTLVAGWTVRDGLVDVTLKNASFTNEHVAGSVSGTYRSAASGPGSVDLRGALVRADAHQVWRYLPVTAPVTQAWLKRALLAGQSTDTRFRLRGPLAQFPFAGDKNGLFEVVTKFSGVTLDYADGWPPSTGISGEAVFRGDRMNARADAGAILGLRLTGVQASIAELGRHAEHLRLKGVVQGPTGDFLRYVDATPLADRVRSLTDELQALGDARLDLELDLPLQDARDSVVKGDLVLQNNRVTLDRRLPALEGFGARISFTERNFTLRDGRALMFGEPLSFDASNQADGGVLANVAGTLDMRLARAQWKYPLLAFLDGQTAWKGTINARNKNATIRFDSNLEGLGSTLPAPFAKPAAANLPLRVELRQRTGRPSLLVVNLDRVASAQLLLDADAPGGVGRGMISLGGSATLPNTSGLWVRGSLEAVDVDAWQSLLNGSDGKSAPVLAGVDLQFGVLDVGRRRYHDLKLSAIRDDDGWQATLAGREVAGQVSWIAEGDGKLQARLAKFVLPPVITAIQGGASTAGSDSRLPSVDLVADSFTYDGK